MVKTIIGLSLLFLVFIAFFINQGYLFKAYKEKDKNKIGIGTVVGMGITMSGFVILLFHYAFHFW